MLLKEKKEIEKWLNKYNVKYYELIPDNKYGYVVNVYENVDLSNKEFSTLYVKFNIIQGNFNIFNNKLTSLSGCPKIINGHFFCNGNELTTLEDYPEIIEGLFYCSYNKLTFEGIQNLLLIKINQNKILLNDNKDLGDLQKITDFNELKKILIIYQEKNKLNLLLHNNNHLTDRESTDKSAEKLNVLIKHSKEKIIKI